MTWGNNIALDTQLSASMRATVHTDPLCYTLSEIQKRGGIQPRSKYVKSDWR